MLDGGFGQLAGLDADVGTDDRVDRAVGRDDVVDAGIEPHDAVGLDIGNDQRAVAIGLGGALIDREAQFFRRNAHAAGQNRVKLQTAGIEHQAFPLGFLADSDALGGTGAAVGGMNQIAAGFELEDGAAAMRGGDHRQFAVDGFGLEDTPDEAAGDVGALVGQLGRQSDGATAAERQRGFALRRRIARNSGKFQVADAVLSLRSSQGDRQQEQRGAEPNQEKTQSPLKHALR